MDANRKNEIVSEWLIKESHRLCPLAGGPDMCLARLHIAIELYRHSRAVLRTLLDLEEPS